MPGLLAGREANGVFLTPGLNAALTRATRKRQKTIQKNEAQRRVEGAAEQFGNIKTGIAG
jgi:hypothetical protein